MAVKNQASSTDHNLNYELVNHVDADNYIGDFYVLWNERAEFVHVAFRSVECLALSKDFLLSTIQRKYPSLLKLMREESKAKYLQVFRKALLDQKNTYLSQLNESSTNF